MKWYDWVAYSLLAVAGVHAGVLGFFRFNIAEFVSFGFKFVENTVYAGVLISGIYAGVLTFKFLKK